MSSPRYRLRATGAYVECLVYCKLTRWDLDGLPEGVARCTQAELAEWIEVSPNTLTRWIRGRQLPANPFAILKLQKIGANVDYLARLMGIDQAEEHAKPESAEDLIAIYHNPKDGADWKLRPRAKVTGMVAAAES